MHSSTTQDEWRMKMTTYLIESKDGVVFGEYEGNTPDEAFAAMVRDGGKSDGAEGTAADWIITKVE